MKPTTLLTPIKRSGSDDITTVKLRKPNAGELRGSNLTDLLRMDVGALIKVLPRITEPALMPDEVADLDPADLLSLASLVVGFFVSPAQQAELEQMTH